MKKLPLMLASLVFLGFLVNAHAQGLQVSEDIRSYGIISYSSFTAPLMVSGKRIVDEFGNEVKLRGFNLWNNDWQYGFGDREPFAQQWAHDKFMPLTQGHLDQIKRWGFNIVEITVWWTAPNGPSEPDENQPQNYNEEDVDLLLTLIRMANEAGLYVLPAVRVCYDPDYVEDGGMPWTGWSTHDYVVFNEQDASGQRGLERYCKYLEWFTEQFIKEPNVAGIDVWHFPYHRQTYSDSSRIERYKTIVAPAMIDAVRKHTNKIIFLSHPGLGWFDFTENNQQPYDDPNIVYNVGGYGYHDIMVEGADRVWDYELPPWRAPHSSCWNFRDTYNVPIMSVEGPGISQHPRSAYPLRQDRLDLFEYLLTLMDDMNGWIVWCYSGPGLRIGVLENENPNDSSSEGVVVEILKQHAPA